MRRSSEQNRLSYDHKSLQSKNPNCRFNLLKLHKRRYQISMTSLFSKCPNIYFLQQLTFLCGHYVHIMWLYSISSVLQLSYSLQTTAQWDQNLSNIGFAYFYSILSLKYLTKLWVQKIDENLKFRIFFATLWTKTTNLTAQYLLHNNLKHNKKYMQSTLDKYL